MNTLQRVKILEIRKLTKATYVLRTTRDNFQFIPGQCVNIGLVGGAVNREYSTYSSTADTYLEFLIKKIPGGLVSEGLSKLKPGSEVTLDGAYGRFVLQKPDPTIKYVFIASGTGIAPFHSYVKSYPGIDYQIIHGIRSSDEQYDKQDYQKNRYIACVSKGGGGNFAGRATEYLKKTPLSRDKIYYLCGNSSMINDVYDILRSREINGSNIYTEAFF
ncbi:hypothetical protein BH11PAT1_BH11PAT1_6380 [soil metagenome]